MKTKGATETPVSEPTATGVFDFEAGLGNFNKAEVLASVADESTAGKYVKDDFFDTLSCDVLDRAGGRVTRVTAGKYCRFTLRGALRGRGRWRLG